MLRIRHIRYALHHPQTNGKIKRFHETLEERLNLLVYTSSEELRQALGSSSNFTTKGGTTRKSATSPRRISNTSDGWRF